MRRRSVVVVSCLTGLVGVVGLALLGGAAERATGEPRFQLHIWTNRGVANGGGGTLYEPSHGAYRIDTQTGEVWSIGPTDTTSKLRFD